jgi:hypothetical protein
MEEYQMNLNQNSSRSMDRLNEAHDSIATKGREIDDLIDTKTKQQKLMQRFFNKRVHGQYYLTYFRTWKTYMAYQQRKNRVACYTMNSMRRSKMRAVFGEWRKWSHQHFKKRMQHD